MSISILEILQNARINLIENGDTMIGKMLGKEQLNNAVTLLEKGYPLDEDFDQIMDKYESVNDVPNYV